MLEASRDYSFCTLSANPAYISAGQSCVLRRFVDFGRRPRSSVHAERRTCLFNGHVSGNQFVGGVHAVQLRAVQLLPAAGRALHVRRVRRL